MNDTYYEQIVTKKPGIIAWVIKISIFILLLLFLVIAFIQPFLSILVIAFGGIAFYYIFPRLKVEYEYSMLNFELNIDAIFNKASRKHLASIDIRNATQICKISEFNKNKYSDYKIFDFSVIDNTLMSYAIILGNSADKKIILLTPDTTLVDMFSTYTQRGVFIK